MQVGVEATPHRVGGKAANGPNVAASVGLDRGAQGYTVQFAGCLAEIPLLTALSHQPPKAPDHTGPWGVPLGRDSLEEPETQKPQARPDQNPELGACRVDRENPRIFSSSGPLPKLG